MGKLTNEQRSQQQNEALRVGAIQAFLGGISSEPRVTRNDIEMHTRSIGHTVQDIAMRDIAGR